MELSRGMPSTNSLFALWPDLKAITKEAESSSSAEKTKEKNDKIQENLLNNPENNKLPKKPKTSATIEAFLTPIRRLSFYFWLFLGKYPESFCNMLSDLAGMRSYIRCVTRPSPFFQTNPHTRKSTLENLKKAFDLSECFFFAFFYCFQIIVLIFFSNFSIHEIKSNHAEGESR